MSSKITTVSQVAKQPSNKPYEGNHFWRERQYVLREKKNISFKFTTDIQVANLINPTHIHHIFKNKFVRNNLISAKHVL